MTPERMARMRDVARRARARYAWVLTWFSPPCVELCVDYVDELLDEHETLQALQRELELELEQTRRHLEAAERERDEAWGLVKAMDR